MHQLSVKVGQLNSPDPNELRPFAGLRDVVGGLHPHERVHLYSERFLITRKDGAPKEIKSESKTAPLKPKGAAPTIVSMVYVCATRPGNQLAAEGIAVCDQRLRISARNCGLSFCIRRTRA
jgi:hypothetical protein